MPRETEAVSENHEHQETENPAEAPFENDEEEEVEYEEVEVVEEIEIEEEVEVDEDEDEEEEEREENHDAVTNVTNHQETLGTRAFKACVEDEKEKHSHLLSLPPHGSQIYVGGIPNDITEDELKSFCESIGEVTEVRIMKEKDASINKGFAFVTFRSVDLACKAIEELHNANLMGKQIKCSTAQAKNRLFINNIPRHWGDEDLMKVVEEVGPGITSLQLVKDMKNSGNRGFGFVDYYNNACADYSRQKMLHPKFKLGANSPVVSWAEAKNTDSLASSQVKAIYVKNLPETVTQEQLKQLFEIHGNISKVVIPPKKSGQENRRIAFVHFSERSNALKALKITEKYELDGQILECSLAKPCSDQKSVSRINLQMEGLLPSYPPLLGHGLLGSGYGATPSGYGGSNFPQPLVYGNILAPPDMAMTPLVLPDGQIGYILQQPGVPAHIPNSYERSHRNGNRGGVRNDYGSGRRHNYDNMRGSRYRPY